MEIRRSGYGIYGIVLASYSYDSIGRVKTVTDSNGMTTTYAYNNLDHPTRVSYPDNTYQEIEYVCCGLPGAVRDRSGRKTFYDYDNLKRLTRVQDAKAHSISLDYDANSNLIQLVDSRGKKTQWEYDALDRVTRKKYADHAQASPSGDVFNYVNDLLMSQVDARGRSTSFAYDALDNLKKIDYATMADVTVGYNDAGLATQMTDGIGTSSFGYDALDRVQSVDGPYAGPSDTVSYGYNVVGALNTMGVARPDGTQDSFSYAYDGYERLKTLSSPSGAFGYAYVGATSQLQQLALPNNAVATYAYDGTLKERLMQVSNVAGDGGLISRYSYGYNDPAHKDARTRVEVEVEADAPERLDFTYDAVDQLLSEARSWNDAGTFRLMSRRFYNYDPMGNRTSGRAEGFNAAGGLFSTTDLSQQNGSLNQILNLSHTARDAQGAVTQQGQSTFSHDKSGNLREQRNSEGIVTARYEYDEAERLIVHTRYSDAGVEQAQSTYRYDGLSRLCISREFNWVNGAWVKQSEIRRIYDGMDVVQERDGDGALICTYTRDGNIGGLLARKNAQGNLYYHYDGSGNVSQLTDGAGTVRARYTYDAYGNTSMSGGSTSSSTTAVQQNRYRYSTKEQMGSGLYNYGYRFYEPGLGRWLNRDPIEEGGGINLYGFVGNNPVNYIDTNGLAKVRVRFKETNVPGGFYHAYIIVTENDGSNPRIWDGWASNQSVSLSSKKRIPNGPFLGPLSSMDFSLFGGYIQARGGAYGPGWWEYEKSYKGKEMRMAWNDCRAANFYNNSFAKTAAAINKENFVYHATYNNSNTVVTTMLDRAGLRGRGSTPPVKAPGWNQALPR